MLETFGDIWRNAHKYDAIVITTNGFIKKNGDAVMGRGIALQAAQKYPEFPRRLGHILNEYGNIVWPFEFDMWNGGADYQDLIFSFPVKPQYGPNGEPGWRVKADKALIKESAYQLVSYVDTIGLKKVLMPRPGCGNGGLKWEDVKSVVEPILDDRFTIMEKKPLVFEVSPIAQTDFRIIETHPENSAEVRAREALERVRQGRKS